MRVFKRPAFIENRKAVVPALVATAILSVAGLSGCASGSKSSAPASTGSAGGSASVGGSSTLQTCSETVGTIRLQDGVNDAGGNGPNRPANPTNEHVANVLAVLDRVAALRPQNSPQQGPPGGVSLDSMRLLIQQSNCFVIVDRGLVERAADDEKNRARTTGEVRQDANMGAGQEVAADFVLRSSVISMGTTQSRGMNLGFLSKIAGGASAGESVTEAKVQLVLSDVRTKVQVAVAQGDGSGSNTRLAANVLGRAGQMLGGVGGQSESKTSGTTILLQAFADAYNKMVPAVQNYKAQYVRGGMGTGGALKVQGAGQK